jgi:hypothetical protein
MMTTRLPLLTLLAVLLAGAALAQPAKPKLETISYADLGKLVRSNKGKVVVVYFWAHY